MQLWEVVVVVCSRVVVVVHNNETLQFSTAMVVKWTHWIFLLVYAAGFRQSGSQETTAPRVIVPVQQRTYASYRVGLYFSVSEWCEWAFIWPLFSYVLSWRHAVRVNPRIKYFELHFLFVNMIIILNAWHRSFLLHCALSLAAQCIVFGPVCLCVWVCLFVGLLPR